MDALLDEVYQRMRGTGPEYEGWLSNHGPMAADALMRLGRGAMVDRWVDQYMGQLDDAPRPRWKIDEAEWRGLIGDASRLGDWLAFFSEAVRTEPWPELLARWWPRLLPGAISSATHGLIRTGHAVRAVAEQESPQRLGELAQALGYWAARWQPAPQAIRPAGTLTPYGALDALPALGTGAGYRTLIVEMGEHPDWASSAEQLAPLTEAADVPAALDHLVDAAVTRYCDWSHHCPVMLVHAATAPRAMALALPSLPEGVWIDSYDAAWTASATIAAAYRPTEPDAVTATGDLDSGDVIDRIVATRDEHALKFAEVAMESHARGNPKALLAADLAAGRLGQNS